MHAQPNSIDPKISEARFGFCFGDFQPGLSCDRQTGRGDKIRLLSADDQAERVTGRLTSRCGSTRLDQVDAVLRRRLGDIAEPMMYSDAIPALQQLTAAGWRICFLANAIGIIDSRPLPVYYSFAEVVVHSWDIGHCKPDTEAFRAVEHRMGLQAHEIVMVGDSPRFDIVCADRAGWSAVHLSRAGTPAVSPARHVISSLSELAAVLPQPSAEQIPMEACDGSD